MANKAVQSEFLLAGVRDSAGNPLAAGQVFHYAAGTLTLKDAWTTSDKSVAAAQPFVLDSQGKGLLYLEGLYKLVIKDSSGVTLYTLDNLAYVIDGSIITVDQVDQPGLFLEELASSAMVGAGFLDGLKIEHIGSNNTRSIRAGATVDIGGVIGITDADQVIDVTNAGHREGTITNSAPVFIYAIPPALDMDPLLAGTNLKYSSTAPTWNRLKVGWYHPTNVTWRCIGFTYVGPAAAIRASYQWNQNILWQFETTVTAPQLLSNGTATGSAAALTTQPSVVCGPIASWYLLAVRLEGAGVAWTANTQKHVEIITAGVASSPGRVAAYAQAAITPAANTPLSYDTIIVSAQHGTISYVNLDSGTRASVWLIGAIMEL